MYVGQESCDEVKSQMAAMGFDMQGSDCPKPTDTCERDCFFSNRLHPPEHPAVSAELSMKHGHEAPRHEGTRHEAMRHEAARHEAPRHEGSAKASSPAKAAATSRSMPTQQRHGGNTHGGAAHGATHRDKAGAASACT